MAYGQHQSFYLRDRWLNKAIKHLAHDNRFFYDTEAFEKMGLGKNMVNSLRFWVVATGVVREEFNNERKKIHIITDIGKLIYKYDRFLQFSETSAILHYHLTKEKEPATVFYWFFNVLNENVITKEELLTRFIEWVQINEEKTISDKSLKRDIDCLINLYTAGQNNEDPEEVIQSPISKLDMVEERKGIIFKKNGQVINIGLTALMYTLLNYGNERGFDTITVEEIISKEGLWGHVFNLSRTTIIEALEKLSHHSKYPIRFTRTNNLDTIRLPNVNPLDFLKSEYEIKVGALI